MCAALQPSLGLISEMTPMLSLREAIDQGKLDQFIAEHGGEIGDTDAFNCTVEAMAGKSKAVPKASSPDDCAD